MLRLSQFKFYYPGQSEAMLTSAIPIHFSDKGLYLITGPSGAGKSTLLSLIKGLSPHYIPGRFDGIITYNSEAIDKEFVHRKKNEIVYLFQNPLNQIVYQNSQLEFCFTAESQQISYDEFAQHKTSIENAFGLKNLWHKKTSQLSLGQAQKLLLGSLIATKPKVLLLDEPTAFMDLPARKIFYNILRELKNKYLVILVDHQLDEVKHMIDSFIVVDDKGQVLQQKHLPTTEPYHLTRTKSLIVGSGCEIILKNISFSYVKNQKILQDINLKIKAPEIIAIRGENGSGKSTLLKILVEALKPTQGKLVRNCKIKDIGYVMQNPEDNFICDTAFEELKGSNEFLVKLFFRNKNLNISPYSLSEGEKRRLSLLVHLKSHKKMILYDEPTFGLDEKNKYLVAKSLLSFRTKNILQIVVSHDETFIKAIADRVFTLKDGKLYET